MIWCGTFDGKTANRFEYIITMNPMATTIDLLLLLLSFVLASFFSLSLVTQKKIVFKAH